MSLPRASPRVTAATEWDLCTVCAFGSFLEHFNAILMQFYDMASCVAQQAEEVSAPVLVIEILVLN